MALALASDYIYQALRMCGQLRPGYQSNTELMTDGLTQWQMMYDGFNAERTMQYHEPDYVFPITGPGHGTTGNGQTFFGTGYQIGPTASDFVATRPPAINRINLYQTSSGAQPTRLPMAQISMDQWMNIAIIGITAINVATVFAYDPQWPNAVIWVWPPLNGNSLEIFTWGELTPPANLSDAYSAPPGYQDVVVYRLAQRLYHLCTNDVLVHKVPFGYLCGQAAKAVAKVKAINRPMPKLACDFQVGNRVSSAECSWSLLLTGQPY